MPATAEAAAITEAYRVRLARLRDAAARAMVQRFQTINLDRPREFTVWANDGAQLIGAAQQQSASMAAAYLDTYTTASGVTPGAPPLDPSTYSGEVNGKRLEVALLAAAAATYWRLGRRAGRPAALATGMDVTIRVSRSAVSESARNALADQMTADLGVVGWRRVTSGRPCGACLGLAGHRMTDAHVFEAHDRCHCTAEPVLGDVPERFHRPTGQEMFDGLDDPQRAELFAGTGGAAKARLVADRGVDALISRLNGQVVETPLAAL